MKLSLTLHNKTYSIATEDRFDGSDVYEMAEHFKGLLVCAGFHPSNVDSIFNLDYQWFTDEENKGNTQGHHPFRDDNPDDPFPPVPREYVERINRQEEINRQAQIEKFQNNMYKDEKPF